MKLTTKGRYAVTAMLDLALHGENGPVTLANISMRQGISLSYLEQLFTKLRRKGLTSSVRGPGGGYCLTVSAKEIKVIDIIDAVDEPVDATQCKKKGNCKDGATCLTHQLWSELSQEIHTFLSNISLHDLLHRENTRIGTEQKMGVRN
ncbi:UNVERIFIED_CONTAM: hypothetical protein GTU68_064302 [Idotea baltica]|nr:hypothetical protein [Idotea baltica]